VVSVVVVGQYIIPLAPDPITIPVLRPCASVIVFMSSPEVLATTPLVLLCPSGSESVTLLIYRCGVDVVVDISCLLVDVVGCSMLVVSRCIHPVRTGLDRCMLRLQPAA
jgi:hypothetical protein